MTALLTCIFITIAGNNTNKKN